MTGRRFAVAVVVGLIASACSGGAAPSSVPTTDESATSPAGATASTTTGQTEPAVSESSVTTTSFPPIYGYGDFSAFSYGQVPWDEVTRLEVACLQDHGVSVEQDSPISFVYTGTEEQSYLAAAYDEACIAGLRVPSESTTTSADIESVYDFWIEQAGCLRELGYSIPDPPSRETFVESYPAVDWVPYRFVPDSEIQEAEKSCPQNLYGG